MSLSPQKTFTPRKRIFPNVSTPSQFSTPKLVKCLPNLIRTPECFTNVLLETPKAQSKVPKEKFDEECNLSVAVRIRPMNASELAVIGAEDVIRVKDKQIIVCPPKYNHHSTSIDHTFSYDQIFWSVDESNPIYSKQEDVFMTIGIPLLNSAFKGFNACLFAYGQTGSGKSYSMMGKNMCDINDIDSEDFSGITPRFCRELFRRVSDLEPEATISIDVSYFEIYNEKIHDLLASPAQNSSRVALKVREHPVLGPYIVDLTTHTVKSYAELRDFLIMGNRNRAVASTSMNDFSSRSHSIFSIEIGQSKSLDDTDSSRRSKVSLVDLAGSERLGSSFNNEEKMKQGVYINKSLLTLGKCISALAEQKRNQFIPYRDSVLTWLLRESLGGNSLTSMLATISPSSTHLDETLSTLRYACQARAIINRARINESPHDRLIRELRSEVERLRALRQDYERRSSCSHSSINSSRDSEVEDIKLQLSETENKLTEAQQIWEQRFMESRQNQLKELAEAEKYRAELESKVRILKTVNEDVSLSPYRTNFLQELEGVLTNGNEEQPEDDLVESIKDWCSENGLICTYNADRLKIVDHKNRKHTLLPLNNLSLSGYENMNEFLTSLKWKDTGPTKGLSKSEMVSSMNQIYQILGNLQPPESDNNLSLLYARVNKTLQKFETALLGSVKNSKTVTFNLE
ncbi:kinesin-like protein KIF14 [Anthonomus grandis grandis]|uniref:kinesin-like protein KIF14 n=1 Tax=Anthonomus grandis grandis TaxID=2921223 RepID=UPI00216624FC|nr:kinesin-like protein KIF14 [Anthonomus grandis grandis]